MVMAKFPHLSSLNLLKVVPRISKTGDFIYLALMIDRSFRLGVESPFDHKDKDGDQERVNDQCFDQD